MRRLLTGASMTAMICLVVACSPTQLPQAPDTPHSIAGRITAVTPVAGERGGTIRVEEQPADASGSAKASVRLEAGATILRGEERVDFSALQVGQWVRVWFRGPVAESYPVQATGSAVVIDSLPR